MKALTRKIVLLLLLALMTLGLTAPALAADASAAASETVEAAGNAVGWKAIAAGIGIGIAALGGAIGMGLATAKAVESIARQPEADGKIRTALMLGLVFIETAIIYALLAGILVIFVL